MNILQIYAILKKYIDNGLDTQTHTISDITDLQSALDNMGIFSGSYDDLIDTPTVNDINNNNKYNQQIIIDNGHIGIVLTEIDN